MLDNIHTTNKFSIINKLGMEWVKPSDKINKLINTSEFKGVAIQSQFGMLVLANKEEYTTDNNCGIRYTLVLEQDLNTLSEV